MLLMKTRVLQGRKFLKIEWVNSIPLPELGYYVGSSHPKTILRKTKPPCTNLKMLNFSFKKGYVKLCYLGNVVVLLVQLFHYKTANLLNLNLLL